jgi:hypothetical protein
MAQEDFSSYPTLEVVPNDERRMSPDVDPKLLENLHLNVCWSASVFSVCVEDWSNNRIKFGFYLAGVRVGQATVGANDPCVRLKEGGDLAKVDVEICADFSARQVVARGKVCVTLACVKFNQVIFNW